MDKKQIDSLRKAQVNFDQILTNDDGEFSLDELKGILRKESIINPFGETDALNELSKIQNTAFTPAQIIKVDPKNSL